MDVSLILTHRCNLDCHYCYAGDHHKTDMEDEVLARAVDLLYADGAQAAQLSFFGGEPFIAFERMRRAVTLAEAKAAAVGGALVLQCTTNGTRLGAEEVRFVVEHGIRLTVSIDGIREAHEANRPRSGGQSSYDQVQAGLERALRAGASCDALMVITPETAQYVYLSVSSLWSQGVRSVRANVALEREWSKADRAELREQLVSVGWELLARRLRGEEVSYKPFDAGMRAASASPGADRKKAKLVVATSGHLYPCAPMVGEDRSAGREAALRLGHLDDGAKVIAQRVAREGVSCERGGGCECAAYLETGDRKTPGPMGRWIAMVNREIGETVARSLAESPVRTKRARSRRPFLVGLAAIVGGAAIAAPLLGSFLSEDPGVRPCRLRTRKAIVPEPYDVPMPGEMPDVYEPPPPPPPEPEWEVDGDMVYEPE